MTSDVNAAELPVPPASDAIPADTEAVKQKGPEILRFQPNRLSPVVECEIPAYMQRYDIQTLANQGDCDLFHAFDVRGNRNAVYIGPGASTSQLGLKISGHRNRIFIGSNCSLRGLVAIRGSDKIVFIGAGTTFNRVSIISKYADVFIGRDCMFSSRIEVRTSDSHAVIDLDKMISANAAEGIYIGDHVWVGKHAVIQKGAYVADDNIVAMSAFVRGGFEQNSSIIAGAPAKVVRTRRSWSRDELVDPSTTDIYAWRNTPLL